MSQTDRPPEPRRPADRLRKLSVAARRLGLVQPWLPVDRPGIDPGTIDLAAYEAAAATPGAADDLYAWDRRGSLDDPIDVLIPDCLVLGGSGVPLAVSERVAITFDADRMQVLDGTDQTRLLSILLDHVQALDVARVEGVTGGVEPTDRIEVAGTPHAPPAPRPFGTDAEPVTLLRVATDAAEIFLLVAGEDPFALRVRLSGVFTRLRLHVP